MCGLVGVAGTIASKDVDAFNELLIANYVRGKHATGVAAVDRAKGWSIIKDAADPIYLTESNKHYDRNVTAGKMALIGHNRHATIGKPSRFNAHPFGFRHIVGAHNGTLTYPARDRLGNRDQFETDSECMYSYMDTHGPAETIPQLEGAWALTFYNSQNNTLNFIRNKERPLFYAYSESMQAIWWASELGMLLWVLDRNNIAIHEKPYILQENSLVSWTLPTHSKPFELPVRLPLEGHKAPPAVDWRAERPGFANWAGGRSPVVGGIGNGSPSVVPPTRVVKVDHEGKPVVGNSVIPFPGAQRSLPPPGLQDSSALSGGNGRPILTLPSRKAERRYKESIDLVIKNKNKRGNGGWRPPYKDYRGQHITKTKFTDWTKGGCSYCEADVHYGDRVLFFRPSDGSNLPDWLCPKCVDTPEILQLMKEA